MPLVNIGDLRLNVTMHGRSGRTLVFVHGNLASADWLELVPVHSLETPICACAAMGSWPIWSART